MVSELHINLKNKEGKGLFTKCLGEGMIRNGTFPGTIHRIAGQVKSQPETEKRVVWKVVNDGLE